MFFLFASKSSEEMLEADHLLYVTDLPPAQILLRHEPFGYSPLRRGARRGEIDVGARHAVPLPYSASLG
jgi:hypothetical protein